MDPLILSLRWNRACLRKASAIRLHTSCASGHGMYVKPPTNSSGFEGGKDLRVFFSIHSLVPGQFLCETFLLVILFHIFSNHAYY